MENFEEGTATGKKERLVQKWWTNYQDLVYKLFFAGNSVYL